MIVLIPIVSMACANKTLKRCGTNGAGEKHRLVSISWDHLVAMESPLWKCYQSSNRAAPIQVVRGLLGRPHLLLGEDLGPAISFSESGGKVWAALCGDASDIGMDVAGPDAFRREYPFHRAFHSQELQHALRLAGGDLEKASALLWSIKEAVVKALVRLPIAADRFLWVRSLPQRKMWLSIALLNRRPIGHE